MTQSQVLCKVCGSGNVGPKYDIEGLSIWECDECGLVFNAIGLEPGFDTRSQYASSYYEERKDYYDETDTDSRTHREKLDSFRVGLDLLEKHKPSRGKLVDVGCGFGTFLCIAKERGWEPRGVDISEHAVSVASKKAGVDVFVGTLKEAEFAENEFDAVSLNDSFEHFADPNAQLEQIFRILKADGILFLNTPNQGALLRVVADAMYRLSAKKITYPVRKLYHEFHLFYYSEENLKRMLEKSGFEIVEMSRKPIPFVKARGSQIERWIVRSFSYLERLLNKEYEILAVARKRRASQA